MDSSLVNRLLGKLILAFSLVLFIPLVTALMVDKAECLIFAFSLITSLTVASLFHIYGVERKHQRVYTYRKRLP